MEILRSREQRAFQFELFEKSIRIESNVDDFIERAGIQTQITEGMSESEKKKVYTAKTIVDCFYKRVDELTKKADYFCKKVCLKILQISSFPQKIDLNFFFDTSTNTLITKKICNRYMKPH